MADKENAWEQEHPILGAGLELVKPLNPMPAVRAITNSTFHPDPSQPGGNPINDIATSLWHAGVGTFNKADEASKAAQRSKSLGEWAGNTARGLGYLGATALPGVGPAAAHAGETAGGNAQEYQQGRTPVLVAPRPLKGVAEGAGLIGSTLLGGIKGRAAGRAMEALAPAERVVEPLEMSAPTISRQTVGSASDAARDTALFQQAKAELGDGASMSQIAQRAQALKTQIPVGQVNQMDDLMSRIEAAAPGEKPTMMGPRAYRTRSVGETGVPAHPDSHAQLTMSAPQARSYMPGREDLTGQPQEVVQVPLDRMSGFSVAPGPGGQSWIKLHGAVPEEHVYPMAPEPIQPRILGVPLTSGQAPDFVR